MDKPRKLKKTTSSSYGTSSGESQKMGALIAELLHGATKTHFTHLKTTSFAAHCALGEFYEAIPALADAVAEQYQGVTEKLLEFPSVNVAPINTPQEAITYLREVYYMVQAAQDMCSYSEIINELDVIKSQINSTKYKLIFLK